MALKRIQPYLEACCKHWKQDYETIEKELKALKIINEHEINVYWLKTSPNLSRYNLAVGTNQALKKDEYDLLKEVLL